MLKAFALALSIVFLVVLSTVIAVNMSSNKNTEQTPIATTIVHNKYYVIQYNQTEYELQPKKNVFFDLGANRGDSALQFAGLEQHSNLGGTLSEQLTTITKRVHGPWEIHMYEAHPKFDEQLLETKAKIEAIRDTATYGGPYHVYCNNRTAIGNVDGEIEFFLDVNSAVTWGSSLIKSHPDVKGGQVPIKVPIHDLAREIMSYRISDYVVVKMDIEGIEHDLIFDLLVRGAFPFIDELYVEFHGFVAEGAKKQQCINDYIFSNAVKYGLKIGGWSR